ncbi:MAG: AMP-binding protein, partial [Desulfobacterales bacterium]|nr:AMP-binding protein [Desulfobacterales bacterium]
MTKGFKWVKNDVDVTEREDGSLILRNKTPLVDHPENLGFWLRQNARKFPDKPFLMQRNEKGEWAGLTHAETAARVNRISNGLVEMGLEAGAPVAVLSENSVEMALIQLAAMQVGLPAAPISFAYSVRSQTGSHIKHILDVTGASILVMSNADLHMPKLNQWDVGDLRLFAFSNSHNHPNVRPLEDLFAGGDVLSGEAERRFDAVASDTPAKIQFTSGSTDLPKGVEVTHGMQITNQTAVHQMWPFLDSDDVVVDWLPWNHTFGGNFVFNMMLMHGGTFYIDNGNPTPEGLPKTIRNIKEVSPTLYFGVPRSYIALYAQMKEDEALKRALFKNLKFIFTAAAALDQTTFEGMKKMSAEVRGETTPFFSAWGCTETAPDATLIYWEIDDARVIGLPIPGVAVKLAPDPSGKMELRVKGPNVTRGYYNNPGGAEGAFDDEGFYRTHDGGRFLHPNEPEKGLIFDGRTTEDFKLASGSWVHNARLRGSINNLGQP